VTLQLLLATLCPQCVPLLYVVSPDYVVTIIKEATDDTVETLSRGHIMQGTQDPGNFVQGHIGRGQNDIAPTIALSGRSNMARRALKISGKNSLLMRGVDVYGRVNNFSYHLPGYSHFVVFNCRQFMKS
jgi:hypothetical protein